MAAQPKPISLIFSVDRDTKTKVRFSEMDQVEGRAQPQPTPKDKAVVEKLYVSKKTLKEMGNPDTLHVTIQAP